MSLASRSSENAFDAAARSLNGLQSLVDSSEQKEQWLEVLETGKVKLLFLKQAYTQAGPNKSFILDEVQLLKMAVDSALELGHRNSLGRLSSTVSSSSQNENDSWGRKLRSNSLASDSAFSFFNSSSSKSTLLKDAVREPIIMLSFVKDIQQAVKRHLVMVSQTHLKHFSMSTNDHASRMSVGFEHHDITAAAIDEYKHVLWAGRASGEVTVYASDAQVPISIQKCNCHITRIAIGSTGIAWVGDEVGRILGLNYLPDHIIGVHCAPKPLPVLLPNLQDLNRGVTQMLSEIGQLCVAQSNGYLHMLLESNQKVIDSLSFKEYGTCTAMMSFIQPVALEREPSFSGGSRNSTRVESGWKLFTGHASGNILIFEVTMVRLTILCSLDPVRSAVRGLAIFPDSGLLVIAQANGWVILSPLPETASSRGYHTGAVKRLQVPTRGRVRAFHRGIAVTAATTSAVAIGPSHLPPFPSHIRLFTAENLRRAAMDQGVTLTPLCPPLMQPHTPTLSPNSTYPRSFDMNGSTDRSMRPFPPAGESRVAAYADAQSYARQVDRSTNGILNGTSPNSQGSLAERTLSRSLSPPALLSSLPYIIGYDELQILEPIGTGAEGTVWRAMFHGAEVAAKEIRDQKSASFGRLNFIAAVSRRWNAGERELPESPSGVLEETSKLDSITREFTALRDLSQHPAIVRFIGLVVDPPRIVTEYYPAGTIWDVLREASQGGNSAIQRLGWAQRLRLLQDVASAMAYLHARSYLHGDLRSPNIFLTADGRAKVGDFGFAKLLQENDVQGPASRTTNPRWLAPEVLNAGVLSRRTDVYSFAICMWEILTWVMPFPELNNLQVTLKLGNDIEFRPQIPAYEDVPAAPPYRHHYAAYIRLMTHCWAGDPELRPSFVSISYTLHDMALALHNHASNGPVGSITPTPPPTPAVHSYENVASRATVELQLGDANGNASTEQAPVAPMPSILRSTSINPSNAAAAASSAQAEEPAQGSEFAQEDGMSTPRLSSFERIMSMSWAAELISPFTAMFGNMDAQNTQSAP